MPAKRSDDYRVVYSTETGSVCRECGRSKTACVCAEKKRQEVRGDGKVRVRRETKGRAGKTVSTVAGLAMNESQLKVLVGELKKACGSGGSVKDGVLEIQGDHCDVILEQLAKRGISAKRAGG